MRYIWLRVVVVFYRARRWVRRIMRDAWYGVMVALRRTREYLRRIMRTVWFKVVVVLALILSPFTIVWLYQQMTAFPKEITIATGPEDDLYHKLGETLAREIQKKLKVKVRTVNTKGSLENYFHLQEGIADFAMYQPSTLEVLSEHRLDIVEATKARVAAEKARLSPPPPGTRDVAFVANLYSMPAHFIVRHDAGIETPAHLKGKTVSFGVNAMSLVIRQHFGLDEEPDEDLEFRQMKEEFRNDTLDAAFITVGVHAPVFKDLFGTGKCDLLSIPHAKALAKNHISMSEYAIPEGFYGSQPCVVPSNRVDTLALPAQLLTRSDVHAGLVEEVTRIVLSQEFLKDNELEELFDGGHQFARRKPHFPTHSGALNFYEPELKPLLPSEFVGSIEGIRQFAASIVIALFLGIRWLRQRRLKKRGHKLDRFMHSLLDIERRQVSLGASGDANDVESLQSLLDEVTFLRQEALGKFSAHELNEERGVDCFLEMCHALSDKIDAKISRQRLDKRFDELADAINAQVPEKVPQKP